MTDEPKVPAKAVSNPMAGGVPLPIIPQSMNEVARFANMVVSSGLAPKGMNNPSAVGIAILHGLELGLTPMAALQRIAVVNGRPTLWGDGALGLIRKSGMIEKITEWVDGSGDHQAGHCTVVRKGETEVTRSFSVAQAKKAGLWNKSGPWQDYPERMLQMRARAFALRDVFPDVLGGLYIREELDEREAAPAPPPPPAEEASFTEIPEKEPTPGTEEHFRWQTAQERTAEDFLDRYDAALNGAKDEDEFDRINRDWGPMINDEPMAVREKAAIIYEQASARFEPVQPEEAPMPPPPPEEE